MSASTVHVTNISSKTSEKEVKDFFSFCGKITSIDITSAGETQKATVTFEKETAAKTALLLDSTALGATQVKVASASGSSGSDDEGYAHNEERDSDEITQEEKPRSRIVAEYLAHGYVIGDNAVQKAIDLDSKHGVSNRFLSTLQSLDSKYHATDKAKSVDQSYGVTQKTNSLLSGLTSYFEKATGTPTGKKLVNFYTQTSRQVTDIHAEARRLADIKKQEAGMEKVPGTEKTTCKCGAVSKDCPCADGACACVDCPKSDVKKVAAGKTTCQCSGDEGKCGCAPGACTCGSNCPKSELKTVPGSDKTTCNCGGSTESCPCAAGKCACSACPKQTMQLKPVAGSDKTTCNCGGSTENCPCAPGKCACNSCPKQTMSLRPINGSDKTECDCKGSTENCPCAPGKCGCGTCPKATMQLKAVPGTDKTVCNCGGSTESCPCAPGKCSCNSCPKSTMDLKPVPGTNKTVCKCGGDTGSCACEAGKCSCGDGCAK
ncbi:hypothetical protein HYFRA_00013284 [Hymenoscyphus fraxineus]|uniref:RRM domain-containing protein n=1 Tax=Hymenoscyphus fraxineus TaxID=746836 RepID=A0A9N9LB18_9HELO|nr:hypothetical protein HYFRA_00013284 [Hymenoscyphus fraxineus]